MLFRRECPIARRDDTQMARPEIFDGSAVEVLLDHRRRHVRATRHGGRISELLRDAPHHSGHGPFLSGLRIRESLALDALREADTGDERSAPGPEVLRAELLPQVDLDVLV